MSAVWLLHMHLVGTTAGRVLITHMAKRQVAETCSLQSSVHDLSTQGITGMPPWKSGCSDGLHALPTDLLANELILHHLCDVCFA